MPQGVIATIPKFQFSANGVPMIGGTLTVYVAGTTTPTNTWQDSALTILNTNPVVLDSRGECVLWLDEEVNYKFVLKNAAGVVQWTQDDLNMGSTLRTELAASSGASLVGYMPAGAGAIATTVQAKLRESVSVLGFFANGVSGAAVDPTGVVDSTLGIQAALNANTSVFFPQGTYRITKTLTVPVYTSISGVAGSVINADFTSLVTWLSDYVALRFLGLAGVDVTPSKYNTVFRDIVISSTAAETVQATGVEVANGATSGAILEARVFAHWENVMVVGFDTGYKINQLSNSELVAIRARDVRVGISIVGKTVNVFMTNLNLYKGTPKTTSVAPSYGLYVDSYFRPTEERPESINVSASLIAAFAVNVYIVRGLLVNISNNVLDLGAGSCCIQVGVPRQVVIDKNWIDCGGVGAGIVFDSVADPTADDLVTITKNVFSRTTYGIYVSARHYLTIEGNDFTGSSILDIDIGYVNYCKVVGNQSKSAVQLVYAHGCDYLEIDKNQGTNSVIVELHPTSNGANIEIGINLGSVQKTYAKGTATITSTNTSVDISAPMGSLGYVFPIIKILNIKSTISPVLTVDVFSYGASISYIRITSNVAAPVGDIVIKYEIVGWWYGQI